MKMDELNVPITTSDFAEWGMAEGLRDLPVLCLGARLGGEVRAFTSLGALAVGVDLNSDPSNPFVLVSDFSHLQFAEAVFGAVYTNVIGHAFNLKKLGVEICRILKPADRFYMGTRKDKNRLSRHRSRQML